MTVAVDETGSGKRSDCGGPEGVIGRKPTKWSLPFCKDSGSYERMGAAGAWNRRPGGRQGEQFFDASLEDRPYGSEVGPAIASRRQRKMPGDI